MAYETVCNPLVSIVVPVYNVAKYLKRCVDSLIKQTYDNIEIILVDDGSTDGSSSICDDYAKTNSMIKVIHKVNGGLSSARNCGLDNSSGTYIIFVDSDDWIHLDTISHCVFLMKKNNADVVQFNMKYVSEYCEDLDNERKEKLNLYFDKDILWHLMYFSTKTDLYFSVCRCLFKKEIIDKFRFEEGKINEDLMFKYLVFSDCHLLVNTNLCFYYYFQGCGSISTSLLKNKDFDLYDASRHILELTNGNKYRSIEKLGKVKYERTCLSLLCRAAYYGISEELDEKDIIPVLKKELKSSLYLLLFSPIPFSRKILAIMFCISFKLTKFMINIVK